MVALSCERARAHNYEVSRDRCAHGQWDNRTMALLFLRFGFGGFDRRARSRMRRMEYKVAAIVIRGGIL